MAGVLQAGVVGGLGVLGGVVLAEAECLGEAVAAVGSPGAARGGAPLVLLEPLVLLDERGVIGLDVLARLDRRAEPDLPGDLAADAARGTAGAGLVVLVDLQFAVVEVIGVGRPGMPEYRAQMAEALRDAMQRGAADDQDAE